LGIFLLKYDVNPERRAFTPEEQYARTRTGAHSYLSRHDKGLTTVIGKTNNDAAGRELDDNASAG
jgi:transcription initiation factor TFIIB